MQERLATRIDTTEKNKMTTNHQRTHAKPGQKPSFRLEKTELLFFFSEKIIQH